MTKGKKKEKKNGFVRALSLSLSLQTKEHTKVRAGKKKTRRVRDTPNLFRD